MPQTSSIVAALLAATFLQILSSHKATATCQSSSDLGRIECHLLYEYSTFQLATCVTKDYIQRVASSRGTHHACADKSATRCYYPCMRETYNIDNGTVLPACECKGPPATPTESPALTLSPQCFSPAGNSCEWYRQCLDARFNCTGTRYDYAIGYGKKFCDLYGAHYDEFGLVARDWIDAARKCLQVKLVPLLRPWVNSSCKGIYDDAFSTHTGCYLSPQDGAPSVCQLPCADLWRIFWLVSFEGHALVSEPIETATQMLQVAIGCLEYHRTQITCLPETVQRLVYVGVTSDRLRSVLKTFQQMQDFAGALGHAIAKRFGWLERGLGWIPFFHDDDKMAATSRQERSVSDGDSNSNSFNMQILVVDRNYLNITESEQDASNRVLGEALFELVNSVSKGEMSALQVTVGDVNITTGVSEVGHCQGMGCNATESYVIATAPSSAVHVEFPMCVLLSAFLLFIWNCFVIE